MRWRTYLSTIEFQVSTQCLDKARKQRRHDRRQCCDDISASLRWNCLQRHNVLKEPQEYHQHQRRLHRLTTHKKNSKKKYVDLCSASSRIASNALPFPVSRRWFLQANQTARHSAHTARLWIRVGISHNMPVYSPSLCRVLIQPGWAQVEYLGAWFRAEVDYLSKDGHPPRH